MGNISIKIKIADRDYPMRVSEPELEKVMLAGKMLQEKIDIFKQKFRVEDKQDLLAMVAFDSFVERLNLSDKQEFSNQDSWVQKIIELDKLVSSVIS
ncbi:MAG: cell division protein ZapA [Cytophagaceae bacterium]|nr:cell division protein ZapA [Cytophagaceae bacterium]MDW8456400.1 cell division protein ZapA [Cytophagaceae bacterium]